MQTAVQTAMETSVRTEGQKLLDSFERAELRVTERPFGVGETILAPGDPDDRLHFLLTGGLRTYKTYSPYREGTTGLLKDGGIFGNTSLALPHRGSQKEYAEALTEVRVASVSKADIASAIERSPELAGVLFSALATQIRRSDECMYNLLSREVPIRLASLLLSLLQRFADMDDAEDHGNGYVIEFRLTHQQLSDMIACTREAVSKAMAEFQRKGLIEVRSRKIRVLSCEGLLLRATTHSLATV